MSYKLSLEKAGAVVLTFKEFGSYQGDWWAKVHVDNNTFWVNGCYGSCSGCDAFQAEFEYSYDRCEKHKYDSKNSASCEDCEKLRIEEDKKLADFGKQYLDNKYTQEEAENKASEHIKWDMEAEEVVKFLKENKDN